MEDEFPPVEDLIPHEGTMVLIDEIISYTEDDIVCRRQVRPDALFVEDGRMSSTVSIEYMAQTIAAYAGYSDFKRGEDVKLAFLLSCRDLDLHVGWFEVGDELVIEASPAWMGDSSLGSFTCSIRLGGEVVATAQLNVYQGELDSVMEKVS